MFSKCNPYSSLQSATTECSKWSQYTYLVFSEDISSLFFSFHCLALLITYMKKCLNSDWLRAVQFFFKTVQLIQCKKRKQTKYSDWSMIRETYRWPIKSFVFKSSARPGNFSLIAWYACVPSAQPSWNFSYILLISNHMIFLVQFGINKHL